MEVKGKNAEPQPPACSRPNLKRRDRMREDVLDKEDYFMGVAFLTAMRSGDSATQVGACIVNEEGAVIGVGYNSMPLDSKDERYPWVRKKNRLQSEEDKSFLEHKFHYSEYLCHAEMNAILNAKDVKNCTIYVALHPCNDCTKMIVQSGIKKVIYYSNKYNFKEETIAAAKLLRISEVSCEQYQGKEKKIIIDFEKINQN